MKNFIILTLLLVAFEALAQSVNTNYLIVTGAGTAGDNGTYIYTAGGTFYGGGTSGFTNLNGNGTQLAARGGAYGTYTMQFTNPVSSFQPEYAASSLTGPWSIVTGTAPAPTVTYLSSPAITNWTPTVSNYWSGPGDYVTASASGRNKSVPGVASNQFQLMLDTNVLFTSPWTSGAGLQWKFSSQISWNGSNLTAASTFKSGDTNADAFGPTVSYITITNPVIGTNTWSWQVLGDTNGLTFDTASLTASRSPSNDLANYSFISPLPLSASAGILYPSNTWNLTTITSSMPNFSIWTGSSNGPNLVTIFLSNGVVRYLQVLH